MAPIRSRRLKLLEGMRRTLCDLLHERVWSAARTRGTGRPPENTSAIYTLAVDEAPALLDQLLEVHSLTGKERGEDSLPRPKGQPTTDIDRKKMLSAIRASIAMTSGRYANP